MIIISQDKKQIVNFDNVTSMVTNEKLDAKQKVTSISIDVRFNNQDSSTIGEFKNVEFGKEVFIDLLMDYRGNAVIEVPRDRR